MFPVFVSSLAEYNLKICLQSAQPKFWAPPQHFYLTINIFAIDIIDMRATFRINTYSRISVPKSCMVTIMYDIDSRSGTNARPTLLLSDRVCEDFEAIQPPPPSLPPSTR